MHNYRQQEGLSFSEIWQIIKKRRFIALSVFVLTVASVYCFTKKIVPVYEASATIELKNYESIQFKGIPGSQIEFNRDTEMRKIESYPMLVNTAWKLEMLDAGSSGNYKNDTVRNLQQKINISKVGSTNLIKISIRDADPQYAIKLANTLAEVYVTKTIEERNERKRKSREFIEEQLASVSTQLRAIEEKTRKFKMSGKITSRIEELGGKLSRLRLEKSNLLTKYGEKHPDVINVNRQIAELKDNMGTLTENELEYINLMRDASINEELYMMLNKQLKNAQIAEADKVIPVSIVEKAREAFLVRPNKKVNMMMGIIAGFILALTGILVTENIDTSVRSAHDVEKYLDIPALAEIPVFKKAGKFSDIPFLLSKNTSSDFLEAFNTLTASVISFGYNKPIKTLLFTSLMPREGKSQIAANYGIVESQTNKVLILDTDFRQPRIHKLFDVSRKPGLIDTITENHDWRTAIQPARPGIHNGGSRTKEEAFDLINLDIMSVGKLPPHPMRFLSSGKFNEIIKKAKQEYDAVILDSPPLHYFADPAILSKIVDGIILIHKPGSVGRQDILRAMEILKQDDSKLLGIVLNGVRKSIRSKYYYRYYSGEKENA